MALPAKYPLIRYLKVESAYISQIQKVLEQAAKEAEAAILKVGTSGNPLTRAQLRAQQAAIKAHMRQTFDGPIKDIIAAGQKAAAADAVKVIGEYEKQFLAALGNPSYMDDIIAGEARRASAGVNKLMARYTSSYKPLSERVYKAGTIANGAIDQAVNVALVRGLSAKDFAKSIYGLISPTTPGGPSYAAMRTARTEINNANHAASQQRYKDSGLVEAVDWHLSTSHPEGDECDSFAANSPYEIDEVPEKPHPQCLCFTTPSMPDKKEFLDKLLRGDYGDEAWEMGAKTSEGALDELTGPRAPKVNFDAFASQDYDKRTKAARAAYEDVDFNGHQLKVTNVIRKGGLDSTVEMEIYKGDDYVGAVTRTFTRKSGGSYGVSHDLMNLQERARGQGFSSAFSKYSEDMYKLSGVKEIKVHAALQDGGYAWARAGYQWDPAEYAGGTKKPVFVTSPMNTILRMEARENDFNAVGPENVKILEGWLKRFESDDISKWPTPQEIANGGAELVRGKTDSLATGKTTTLGKRVMTGSNWFGVKSL